MDQLRSVLQQYWGYDQFRPLQQAAMTAVLENRDSVVVLPTGGGKSLCFQAPALCLPGLAVVVSPLISLMKDQVDTLTECGVAAAFINSSLTPAERFRVANDVRNGKLKLLYIAPERLCTEQTRDFLKQQQIAFFAIDEAHCISSWGHDFRPEYRMLGQLKQEFPGVAIHAYTATATEPVREDIARQLQLDDPIIHVGSFDRPNLTYRVLPRHSQVDQVRSVLDRHAGESGIVYCIRRTECQELSTALNAAGYLTRPYHAGLTDVERKQCQEAFLQDRVRTIIATVAFGMGIDKPDVRYVIHAAAPKSLEGYQQESGRAGRDGLEAECVVLYSGQDFMLWRRMQSELSGEASETAETTLRAIQDFCQGVTCRHKHLVEYFGQEYPADNCQSCDVCLEELDLVDDAQVISQKILSAVVRLQQKFGADYTCQVLIGSREQRILDNGHDQLSTYGLLKSHGKKSVRTWIEQLVGQGYLVRTGEYQTLQLTNTGAQVLKGQIVPRLLRTSDTKAPRTSKAEARSWAGVDRELFDALRTLRKEIATERGLQSFLVFSDATLRDMSRRRPTTLTNFHLVNGVGDKKAEAYGPQFLKLIQEHCQQRNLPTNDTDSAPTSEPVATTRPAASNKPPNAIQQRAFDLFRQRRPVAEVAEELSRATSTTLGYLHTFLQNEKLTDPTPWLAPETFAQIRDAVLTNHVEGLRTLYDHLGGAVSYDDLRLALICLRNATTD